MNIDEKLIELTKKGDVYLRYINRDNVWRCMLSTFSVEYDGSGQTPGEAIDKCIELSCEQNGGG